VRGTNGAGMPGSRSIQTVPIGQRSSLCNRTPKRFDEIGEASPPDAGLAATQSGAVGTAVVAAILWVSLPSLDSILHPLPGKRFVALMVWPAEPNSTFGPLLKNVLATTGNQLARAEVSAKDLLVISPGDVTGQAPPKALRTWLVRSARIWCWRRRRIPRRTA